MSNQTAAGRVRFTGTYSFKIRPWAAGLSTDAVEIWTTLWNVIKNRMQWFADLIKPYFLVRIKHGNMFNMRKIWAQKSSETGPCSPLLLTTVQNEGASDERWKVFKHVQSHSFKAMTSTSYTPFSEITADPLKDIFGCSFVSRDKNC